MNRPDHEVAAKIVEHLERGAQRLDSGTLERLAAARQKALSRYRERREPAWGWAWAWSAAGQRGGARPNSAYYLAAVGVLVLALIGFGYWQATAVTDFSDVDVKLLTDDLPINAYLDTGFDSWLKRASR